MAGKEPKSGRPNNGRRGTNPNSLANLKRGENFDNAGGGAPTTRYRQKKQDFIDQINETVHKASGKTVGEMFRLNMAIDILGDPDKAQWWAEFQWGKPNAKMELVIENGALLVAFGQAMHEAGVDPEKFDRVMTILDGNLNANPDAG